jgi:transcription-repair coupling factor (superfamily II helicase)
MSPGEYSVRGGLIDLFPMGSALPYRLDLFGDEIETIRTFDADTQRSLYPVGSAPAAGPRIPDGRSGAHRLPRPLARALRGRPVRSPVYKDIGSGIASAGIEYYLPLFFEETATLFDYLPDDAAGPGRRHRRRDPALLDDTESRYRFLKADRERPILEPKEMFLGAEQFFTLRQAARPLGHRARRRHGGVRAVGADSRHRRQPPPRRSAGQPALLPAAGRTRA